MKKIRKLLSLRSLVIYFGPGLLAAVALVGAVYGFVQWTNYHEANSEIREVLKTFDPERQRLSVSMYDLKAQQEMAEWSYALFWLGFVSLVASIAGIGFVLMNLLALNEQNLMARRFGEAQTRPYLTIGTPASLHQTGNSNGQVNQRVFEIELDLINSGSTPAVDVQVFFAFYFMTEFHNFARPDEPMAEFSRLDLAPLAANRSSQVSTRFNVSNETLGITPETREANCEIAIAVLVLYRDVSGEAMHELCIELSSTTRWDLSRGLGLVELSSATAKRWFIDMHEHAATLFQYSDPDREGSPTF